MTPSALPGPSRGASSFEDAFQSALCEKHARINLGVDNMIQGVVRQNVIEDSITRGLFHLENPPALIGISERYLANAEQDFERFINYEHPYWAVRKIIQDKKISMDGAVVIDVASGFGNTVIPLLKDFQRCNVVASDLSESILRILLREADKEGVGARVQAVVVDGQDTTLWSPSSADLVVGGAALHHMIDPSLTISTALSALKPGGTAIFIEPMEVGHAILRLAMEEVLRLPVMHVVERYHPAANHIRGIIRDIEARTHHGKQGDYVNWENLDDKWVFPRSYLEEIARKFDCTVGLLPLYSGNTQFTKIAIQSLESYGGLKSSLSLPQEAIEVFNRFDSAFSERGHADIPVEAAVTFTRM
ncbi:class I SAM-dependent methyltransferase [Methylobacterium sp. OAE515]|uniref:class I SAM-dependent methyltransferase n=1 Tax=Methylobacterium sp. OAE515 TaxID=2817895 RepID=UPI001789A800